MGRGKNHGVQKKIMSLLSDGEIWTNTKLYEVCSQMKYGPDSWSQFYNMLGQLARFTPKRLSNTHQIIALENFREYKDGRMVRHSEYMLQER